MIRRVVEAGVVSLQFVLVDLDVVHDEGSHCVRLHLETQADIQQTPAKVQAAKRGPRIERRLRSGP